jgi:hypothetical protein
MHTVNIDLLSDEEILNTRVKDLDLSGAFIYRDVIKVLHSLLSQKSIIWKPHVWPSTEWFSPDGSGGFAIPFTLYHPKLIELEKKIIGYCEGEDKQEFLKLISHESGHAIDNAFRLRRKKRRQEIFGLTSKRYPKTYTPNPNTKDYVNHLDQFYGQSHPDEDWAETFAVWLTKYNWKTEYKKTGALKKLIYLNSVMCDIAGDKSFKNVKKTYQHSKNETRTVREVLLEKKRNLGLTRKNYYTKILSPKFTEDRKSIKAYNFLLKNEARIINKLNNYNHADSWTITKSYQDIKSECRNKNYYLKYTSTQTNEIIENIIIQHAQNFKETGRAKVYM